MIKVGLTGNIASGKSQVEKILTELGYSILDTDNSAHFHLKNSKEVYDLFHTNERKEIAKTVFYDKEKLASLEKIIHPLVKKDIVNFFELNKCEKIAFVSVPQLFEAKMEDMFDKIILVTAPYDTRLQRLIKRNNYEYKYAKLRLDSQLPQEEKAKKSDLIIANDSDLEALKQKTTECLRLLL